jgi:glutamate/tyrosine decarboxylase-like PLP-dependent enzyme
MIKTKGEMMKDVKEIKELSRHRVDQLERKLLVFMKARKEYTPEEKFVASIRYSKLISDTNQESKEDFLINVITNTMTLEEFKDIAKRFDEPEIMFQ